MSSKHAPEDFASVDLTAERRQRQEAANIRYVAALSETWQKEHSDRSTLVEQELMSDRPRASADEKLLLRIAAHDTALAKLLGDTEVQLAKRIQVLIDNADVGLKLARTLAQVTACRSAAAVRMREALQAAAVLAGQRRLTEAPHLRRAI